MARITPGIGASDGITSEHMEMDRGGGEGLSNFNEAWNQNVED